MVWDVIGFWDMPTLSGLSEQYCTQERIRKMMVNQWFGDPSVQFPFRYWWTSTPRYSSSVVGLPTLRSYWSYWCSHKHERKSGNMNILLGDVGRSTEIHPYIIVKDGWILGLPVSSCINVPLKTSVGYPFISVGSPCMTPQHHPRAQGQVVEMKRWPMSRMAGPMCPVG